MPIVQTGFGQLSDIITKSNGDLSTIGRQIRCLGAGYEALRDQKFGARTRVGDPIPGWPAEPK
jgi:hypothetical protein